MIEILEKPDWVSWDDIHEVLMKAHASNRKNGIIMRLPSLPGYEIEKIVGGDGKMFVALDGNRVIGTAAIVPTVRSYWCGKNPDKYACVHFDAILPEYSGKGVFKKLDYAREKTALSWGIDKMMGDTHEHNYHRLEIAKKSGYKFVDYKNCRDHNNIIWVKWLNGCPYSDFRCWYEFKKRKCLMVIKRSLKSLLKRH